MSDDRELHRKLLTQDSEDSTQLSSSYRGVKKSELSHQLAWRQNYNEVLSPAGHKGHH